MPKVFRRLLYWTRQRRLERELAEEMAFHQSMKQRELEQDGLAPEDAAFAARRSLGNLTRMREESRAVWIAPWIESVWQDLCYAVRSLRAQRGFTFTVLAALAVAIGLNTSVFTVFNALAFRPWPVSDPGSVVRIYGVQPGGEARDFDLRAYRYFREHSKTFAGIAATRSAEVQAGGAKARGAYVGGDYFRLLGVRMHAGRGFRADEDLIEAPQPVVVLSYALWQGRYGGDPEILGGQIRLNEVPFTVVGIASAEFTGTTPPSREDWWAPLAAMTLAHPHNAFYTQLLRGEGACCAEVSGRLAPGVTREQARAELEVLNRQQADEPNRAAAIVLAGTAPLASRQSAGRALPVFGLLFLGVTLLLLLACANAGNLLLARAAARRHEIAVRLSLGAGRARVVRQLLTESLVLACAAGALGVALACWLPERVIRAMSDTPLAIHMALDARVLGYTLAIAVVACVVFGLAPALHATRTALAGALKARTPVRGVLLGAQVAISIVLLVAAGLMVRGLQNARTLDPGFALADVAATSIELPVNAYDAERTKGFVAQLEGELASAPEFRPVGLASAPPLGFSRNFTSFTLPGEDTGKRRPVMVLEVSSGYFDVLRIPVLAGRNLEAGDSGRQVILINQTAANRFWPGESPMGKMVLTPKPYEVAGVVRDACTADLGGVEPTFYYPLSGRQVPHILARRDSAAAHALPGMIARLDPRATLRTVTLAENLERLLRPSAVGATLAGLLGLMALALATVGMFGVFGYVVEQRAREIGIRIALGASPGQAIGSLLRASSRAVLAGLAVGFVLAAAFARLIESQLYGVGTLDPLAYLAVAGLVSTAAMAATFVPARRAARIDPTVALRYE